MAIPIFEGSYARPVFVVDGAGGVSPAGTAAAPSYTIQGNMVPKGYQQIVGLAASTALTVPGTATYAVVQAEAQGVRYRDDGVPPTATVGQPIASGASLTFYGAAELAALRFFQQAATATLNISYYG